MRNVTLTEVAGKQILTVNDMTGELIISGTGNMASIPPYITRRIAEFARSTLVAELGRQTLMEATPGKDAAHEQYVHSLS